MMLFVLSHSVVSATEPDLVRRQFREAETLFANPGQGWMSEQRRPRGEARFPCSVVYIRFNWAEAEPAEGQFNWKLMKWANVGVGKLHRSYALRFFLREVERPIRVGTWECLRSMPVTGTALRSKQPGCGHPGEPPRCQRPLSPGPRRSCNRKAKGR